MIRRTVSMKEDSTEKEQEEDKREKQRRDGRTGERCRLEEEGREEDR